MNKYHFPHHLRKPDENKTQRMRRLIVGVLVTLVFICFIAWSGWGWLFALPFILDYYFVGLVDWGFYQKFKNRTARKVCGLIADVIFVVIAVTLVQLFFVQNFAIPSSSLEKTMLIGDYLAVDKVTYGPRMPMTPVAVPMFHNTLPGGIKSYSDRPQLKYRRLRGIRPVRHMDLVVFNFPAGDTVAVKKSNLDFYTLCHMYGRERVMTDVAFFGKIVSRPVDRRDHYVKRVVGLPGDTLAVRKNQVMINGRAQHNPKNMQLNYWLLTDGTPLTKELLDVLHINYRDVAEADGNLVYSVSEGIGLDSLVESGNILYHLPLTQEMKEKLQSEPYVKTIRVEHDPSEQMYPLGNKFGWTRDNYGPIYIPAKGATIPLTPANIALYARCIHAYEGHSLEVKGDVVLIDGKPATTYTFEQDYYWMMGDNRHMSADSRHWGFVPEDHIVGRPLFIFLSLNNEQGLFSGKIRFNRMLRTIPQD